MVFMRLLLVKLLAPHHRWHSYINGGGEFIDGQHISWNGVNFAHNNALGNSLNYCISIDSDGMRIASPQLDGYKTEGSDGKTVIVPSGL